MPNHFNNLFLRSKGDWLVGELGTDAVLKAPMSGNTHQPPTSGWMFHTNGEYKEDDSVFCSDKPRSQCCTITIMVRGEDRSFSAGKYKNTDLISMGRQVICPLSMILKSFSTFAGFQTRGQRPAPLCETWRGKLVDRIQIERG